MQRRERIRKASPELIESARYLRRHQTRAEAQLWEAIRGQRAFPYRVRRQHAVGSFVLDFWIPAARLAVEIDGEIHDLPDIAAQDAERATMIAAHDVEVIRFRNEEVLSNLDHVLTVICERIDARLQVHDTAPPLLESGEGVGG